MTKKRDHDIEQLAPYSPVVTWTQGDVCGHCMEAPMLHGCQRCGAESRLTGSERELHLGNVSLRNRQAKRGTA